MSRKASPSTASCPPATCPWPCPELHPFPSPPMKPYDTTQPYPRDLIGYGRDVPHAQWPGQARIAVQFVLNYEEGGENATLHGDAGSEQFLSEMFNPASYPDRHMSMEGIYEYGSRVGVWRILREFEKRGLPMTIFGVGMALQRHPTHPPPGGGRRPARIRQRLLRRRPAVLDEGRAQRRRRGAAPGGALHAGHQRHAFFIVAGLLAGRRLFHLPARQLRLPVRRGRPGR